MAEKYRIEVLEKALDILEILALAEKPMQQAEIIRISMLPQNQVMRILKTLELREWAKKEDKRWFLGEKAWLIWAWTCKEIEKMRELE